MEKITTTTFFFKINQKIIILNFICHLKNHKNNSMPKPPTPSNMNREELITYIFELDKKGKKMFPT